MTDYYKMIMNHFAETAFHTQQLQSGLNYIRIFFTNFAMILLK